MAFLFDYILFDNFEAFIIANGFAVVLVADSGKEEVEEFFQSLDSS